jgi:DNA invertase Pin-like site-specific DNA recombinase
MIVGYARTSTAEQVAGFEAQERDLRAAGAEKIFKEQTSSVGARKALDEALEFVRQGDVFMVTKLDRLARSVKHLIDIAAKLQAKSVALQILNLKLDTGTPTGEMQMHIFAAVAQFERGMMLERQKEGIAKAKGEGKYKGRAATARAKSDQVLALAAEGKRPDLIAERLGIGRASVYRIMRGCLL